MYGVITDIVPIAEILMKGYCLYHLTEPFMDSDVLPNDAYVLKGEGTTAKKRNRRAACAGVVYALAMLWLYFVPVFMTVFTAYAVGGLLTFCFICMADQRNYRQKGFLMTVFFSLNWLSAAMAQIMYDNLYAFAENTSYMRRLPDMMWVVLYAGVCLLYLVLEFSFIVIGIRQVLKAYRNKSEDMSAKELIMLLIPSLMSAMVYRIIRDYRRLYWLEDGENKTVYEVLIVMFYALSVLSIVVVIVLYQDIKAKQEENRQAAYLSIQIEHIRRHIGQVESLYENIRSIKHDMTNHILMLERLYEENHTKEATAYGTELKAALAEMTGDIASGNAVTDVILQEWQKEAEKLRVCFRSEFYYPKDTAVNVFDLSVILNNALQNAIEHALESKEPHLSVRSYHRDNAYMIEVRNGFEGDLQWDTESGLPVTSKEKADGHGYGLPNIRRVARKYFGDIAVDVKDGEFCLSIMLMLE